MIRTVKFRLEINKGIFWFWLPVRNHPELWRSWSWLCFTFEINPLE